jgi:hypothetical protein
MNYLWYSISIWTRRESREYTLTGDYGPFLAYVQWWWYFPPSLLRVGYKPTLFNSIFLLHSSFAAPFTLSPSKLARNSYLLSRTATLPFSLDDAMETPQLYFLYKIDQTWQNAQNVELFWKINLNTGNTKYILTVNQSHFLGNTQYTLCFFKSAPFCENFRCPIYMVAKSF